MSLFSDELPVVLTATIIPNVAGTATLNPEARLAEYRRTLQYCQQFAPVIFLENSSYPLEQHPEFRETSRLRVRRFPSSTRPERGKGYQEFEMLDAWLGSEPQPPARWLKISGRYQPLNLVAILSECRREHACRLLMDQVARLRRARTYLFYIETAFYQERFRGLFRQCDDRTGNWIEHVVFRELEKMPPAPVRFLKTQPRLQAYDGSSGIPFPAGQFQWLVKQGLRSLNRLVDQRRLWYAS
jgi:hypothetical protein